MASESREDQGAEFDVPTELREWLDDRAATLGVGREELVVQILSSYHAAATMDGHLDAAEVLDLSADDFVDVETAVDEAVDGTVTEQVDDILSDRSDDLLAERAEDILTERADDILAERADDIVAEAAENAVAERLDETIAAELDDLDSKFQEKLTDVRERVIQVKKETDDKAPANHTHDELAAVDALDERLDDIAADLAELRDETAERLDEQEATTQSLLERVDDAEEKLNRVAWVVSDLKDETTGRDAHAQAVDRIKRAAAQESVDTATCERCDESVHIGLLTDPQCPHCNATVSDVRPAGGIFRKKARLVAASQLESGEEPDDA